MISLTKDSMKASALGQLALLKEVLHVLGVGGDGVHIVQVCPALGEDGPSVRRGVLKALLPLSCSLILSEASANSMLDVSMAFQMTPSRRLMSSSSSSMVSNLLRCSSSTWKMARKPTLDWGSFVRRVEGRGGHTCYRGVWSRPVRSYNMCRCDAACEFSCLRTSWRLSGARRGLRQLRDARTRDWRFVGHGTEMDQWTNTTHSRWRRGAFRKSPARRTPPIPAPEWLSG